MKTIYRSLYKKIAETHLVNWIDIEKGQLKNYNTLPPVDFPCVLLNAYLPTCEDINTTEQLCTVHIEVTVVFETLPDQTDTYTPEEAFELSIKKQDIIDDIHKALQGFSTDELSPLSRKSCTPYNNNTGINGTVILYESTFTEDNEN